MDSDETKIFENVKCLVVDDSRTMRMIIINILTQLGFQKENIFEAGDGKEGLELFNDSKPDLVLSDINMPVMNGFKMVSKLRETTNKETCPIFMITTEGGKNEVLKLLKLGANNYIVKPVKPDSLKEKIREQFIKI